MAQVVEYLPSKHEALSLHPVPQKKISKINKSEITNNEFGGQKLLKADVYTFSQLRAVFF
jgi:hypothetical protein